INGGLNTFLYNLIHDNIKKNQIELICNKKFNLDKSLKKKIIIHRFNFKEDKNKFFKYLFSIKKILKFVKILEKIKNKKFLVVNGGHPGSINSILAIIAWKIKKKNAKIIYNFHNLASKANYKNFIIHLFSNFVIFLFTAKVITVSKAALKSIDNLFLLKKIKKKFIFNGSIDLAIHNNYKKKNNKKYFLILASYEKRKGIQIALDAFNSLCEKHDDYHLYVCGDKNGGYYKSLKKQASNLKYKARIKLYPFVKNKINLLNQCEVLLLPSISYESFGYTLIEAMSLSKIVMASNVGGIPEVVKNKKNGYIFQSNNSKKLLELFMFFIKEKISKKNNIKKNARLTYLKVFNSKKMTNKYVNEINLL
ncbi:glycosyltransferase family 4 protein, partial [Candidatus Pelagibacter sp.]|nr:glycosyltransferase family 4 protein [Candidatus Pelagibacter sp.]